MKKIISVSLIFMGLLSLTSRVSAQGMRLGFRTLPNISWLHSNSDLLRSNGASTGISYGLTMDRYFTENYAFNTGMDVIYRGGILEKAGVSAEYSLQYIEIPVTIKLRTNQVGPFLYYGQMGLGVDINIHHNYDVNPAGLSLVVGGGLEIPFSGKTSFLAGILFHNGLTDVIPGDDSANGNYLALNLGILF